MIEARLVRALAPLVEAFGQLGIDYQVGGSIASSVHGVPRSSLDIDILASLRAGRVAELVKMIEHDYYVSGKRASEAVERESSFNIIHLETMFKLDIFIARSDRFRLSSLGRRRSEALSEERVFFVTSAEDIVLHKLLWLYSSTISMSLFVASPSATTCC